RSRAAAVDRLRHREHGGAGIQRVGLAAGLRVRRADRLPWSADASLATDWHGQHGQDNVATDGTDDTDKTGHGVAWRQGFPALPGTGRGAVGRRLSRRALRADRLSYDAVRAAV